MTLPRLLRNRLAAMILDALHDGEARRGLETVTRVCSDPTAGARLDELPERGLRECFEERDGGLHLKDGWKEHADDLRERARRAWKALAHRPLDPSHAPLGTALSAAAVLFDAGLYYETHEWLEPYWLCAVGADREALQGLIQIAVGFEHLAGGNVAGARSLLMGGCAKIRGRRLEGLDLDSFARATRACLDRTTVPRGSGAPHFPGSADRRDRARNR